MARLVFGADDVSVRGSAGTALLSSSGQTATVYTDAAATTLANLLTYPGGVAVAGGVLTIDAYSRIPLFQGPNDGTDTLYVVVSGGPATAIYARTDDRIDANTAGITAAAATVSPTKASDAWLKLYAANPDLLIVGAVTRDANGAATSAAVVWPDGSAGTYTATAVSTSSPGAVDAYTVTYGSPVTKTVTQAAVTRDASGNVTTRPALTVA